ncbi:efflux RND transporter periplasmic adaptor subunit [Vreelandella profundi]|uniref:efflux RND transporter periplasmic adaptor subunit n=1 Tax=Vreelandella profundi TaxID=2852117 RepID=UPI001EF0A61A|nr:efflux RND transporter periplasmic adaptor subunit [Halomonas profundi]
MHFPFRRRLFSRLILVTLTLLLSSATFAQLPPSVIGTRAVMTTWSDPLEALGTLSAEESVVLSTTVTEIVAQINFEDGEQVEEGQLLIRLDDTEEQAQLRSSQALRDERRNTSTRASQLQERNLAARADVEDSQSRLRQAEADIQAIEARLANYQLRAPFSGRVGFRNISIGALVTPGMELVTLDKLDVMKLDFSVPEVFLGRISPGLMLHTATATYPDDIFNGQIATIGTRVDPVTRSVNVRAILDNADGRLRPGMLMQVIVQQRVRDAVVIPEAAIEPSGDRHSIMVIEQSEGSTRLTKRVVSIGERRYGEVEILEGLAADELVVVHGLQLARDGQEARLLGIVDDETSLRALLEADR